MAVKSAELREATGNVETADSFQRIVKFLSQGDAYSSALGASSIDHVDVIETHISVVFLAGSLVYKLKKPVKFDFLDYSTVELRRHACEEELRLNRRQAHGVYLGVLPIWTDERGRYHLGHLPEDRRSATAKILDWVVQMRRLPTERALDEMIRHHTLTDSQLRQLSETLAQFYANAAPLTVRPDTYRRAIEQHLRANRETLLAQCDARLSPLIKRLHTAQLRTLVTHTELFDSRVLDGRVIDGHGDLRPEHIYLLDPPVVFDCIEFNAEFRQLDVVDELSFLAMECDLLGAPEIGNRVLDEYRRQSGDRPEDELLAFYKAYRAAVRAKVAILRGGQTGGAAHQQALALAERYLYAADNYLKRFDRPLLMIVGGLMGTGKSTLAREISERLAIEWLRSDIVRQQMFAPTQVPSGFAADRYQPERRAAVYDELFRQAEAYLDVGVSVVLDATFTRLDDRHAAAELGRRYGADVIWVECRCPREVAIQRIEARLESHESDPSEARPELYDRQAADWQDCVVNANMVSVDTTDAVASQMAQVVDAMRGS